MMNKDELLHFVAAKLQVSPDQLRWSDKCRNPLTNYHYEDGTIKGSEGYWVLKE